MRNMFAFLAVLMLLIAIPALAVDENEREDIVFVETTQAPLHFIGCLPKYVAKGCITSETMVATVEAWNRSGGRVEKVWFPAGSMGTNHWIPKAGGVDIIPNYRVPDRYLCHGKVVSVGGRWAWRIGPVYCFEGCTNLWIPQQAPVTKIPTETVTPIPPQQPAPPTYTTPECPPPTATTPTARLNLTPIRKEEIVSEQCITIQIPCWQPVGCYYPQPQAYCPPTGGGIAGGQVPASPMVIVTGNSGFMYQFPEKRRIIINQPPTPPTPPDTCDPGGYNPDPSPGDAFGGIGDPNGFVPGGDTLPPGMNPGMYIPVPDHGLYGSGAPQIGTPSPIFLGP